MRCLRPCQKTGLKKEYRRLQSVGESALIYKEILLKNKLVLLFRDSLF